MKLLSLTIHRFAALRDLTLSFTDGIHLLYGENEAGKSSIAECLLFVFYGFADEESRNRFCPWDSDHAAAQVRLLWNETEYLVTRTVYRDGTDEHTIRRFPQDESCFVDRMPWEVFLGIPQELYRRSAFFSQKDGLRIEGAPMEAGIQNLLLAADQTVDVPFAAAGLKRLLLALEGETEESGFLYETQTESEILSTKLQAAQNSQMALLRAEHTLHLQKEKQKELEQKIEEQEELLRFYEEGTRRNAFIRLNTKRNQAQEAAEELQMLENSLSHNGFFPDRAYIQEIQTRSVPLNELTARKTALEQRCDELKAQLAIASVDGDGLVRTRRFLRKRKRKNAALAAVFGVGMAALTAVAFLFAHTALRLALCFGAWVVLALFCLLFLSRRNKASNGLKALYRTWKASNYAEFSQYLKQLKQEAEQQQQRRNEYNQKTLEYQSVKEDYLKQKAEMDALLGKWGKHDPESTIAQAEEALQRHLTLSHKAELAASELLGYQVLLPVSEEEMQRFQTTPYDFPRFDRCNGDIIKAELGRLTRERNFLLRQIEDSYRTVSVLRTTVFEPAKIQERLLQLQTAKTQGEQTKNALQLAITALSQASDKIREGLTPRLSQEASDLMALITDGRHTALQISDAMQPHHAATQKPTDENYSAGTSDAAYLSLRLALAKVLFHPPLPLVFDEAFTRLDDQRFQSMMELLCTFASEGNQILFFTNRKRDAALAASVAGGSYITLPGTQDEKTTATDGESDCFI